MPNSSELIMQNDPIDALRRRIDELNEAAAALERERERLRMRWDFGSFIDRKRMNEEGQHVRPE